MDMISLFLFVLTLGMRHGLDADHLACIDGMVRHNMRAGHPLARFVGAFFSLGHGMVVAVIAVLLGWVSQRIMFSENFDRITTAASIWLLLAVGTLNLIQLRRTSGNGTAYAPRGLKSKWAQSLLKKSANPLMVVGIGALFALAADTVTQTSVWVLAAKQSGPQMSLWLGLTFMVGMMITDTLDSLLVHRLIQQFSRWGAYANRGMGYLIVLLAYGVSVYEFCDSLSPGFLVDFVAVSFLVAILLAAIWLGRSWRLKKQVAALGQETDV